MEIRNFRSEYKLELIPASHEGISLGDLVWDPILDKAGLEASLVSEGSHAVVYEFSHDNVPFAMRIERVRNFNG